MESWGLFNWALLLWFNTQLSKTQKILEGRWYVSLFPTTKDDKEPADCSSYRHLSRLGNDVKIYAKLLAHRLRPTLRLEDCSLLVPWCVLEEQLETPGCSFKHFYQTKSAVKKSVLLSHTWFRLGGTARNHVLFFIYGHLGSPIYNKNQIQIGQRPITFSQWEKKGIHTSGDVY